MGNQQKMPQYFLLFGDSEQLTLSNVLKDAAKITLYFTPTGFLQ
jgi:hypothetical protein